jgi:hypothetical protein
VTTLERTIKPKYYRTIRWDYIEDQSGKHYNGAEMLIYIIESACGEIVQILNIIKREREKYNTALLAAKLKDKQHPGLGKYTKPKNDNRKEERQSLIPSAQFESSESTTNLCTDSITTLITIKTGIQSSGINETQCELSTFKSQTEDAIEKIITSLSNDLCPFFVQELEVLSQLKTITKLVADCPNNKEPKYKS